MTDTQIIHLAMQVMLVSAKLAAPVLVTSLVIGFAVSLFQSATQIQEFTLAFVPKAVGVGIALLICGHWMLTTMVSFTQELFAQIPKLLG
ncbi:MAG: fliQ [Pseudonocardiales bacterium]|jgi:flagellar biosynthetic protein FliQ|nr:fliQ [Pseudonocardiales bacterium]